MKRKILIIASITALLLVAVAMAATTTTSGKRAAQTSTDITRGLYEPAESILKRTVVTQTSTTDGSVTVLTNTYGYLDRVTISADGSDTDFDATVTDVDSYVMLSLEALDASDDPCSYAITLNDSGGNAVAGVPFGGGLTLAWVDANDSSTTEVEFVLWYQEAWQ